MRRLVLAAALLPVVVGCNQNSPPAALPTPPPSAAALPAPTTDVGPSASQNAAPVAETAPPRSEAAGAEPSTPGTSGGSSTNTATTATDVHAAESPASDPAAAAPAAADPPTSAPADPAASLPAEDIVDRVDEGIVLITIQDAYGNDLGFGSGFVVDADGHVVTNYHVISQATRAFAEFQDGTRTPIAGYVAWNIEQDLSILKLVEVPPKIDVLTLATGDGPRRGEEVLAFGHPTGLRFLTTRGIVSAVERTDKFPEGARALLGSPDDTVWIQTDTTTAGGSSGGPLLNRRGEVIGVNTRVATRVNISLSVHARHLAELLPRIAEPAVSLTDPRVAADPFTGALGDVDPQIVSIVQDFQRSLEELQYLVRNADTPEKRQEVIDQHPGRECVDRLIKLAEVQRGSPLAFQSLLVACQISSNSPWEKVQPALAGILATLSSDHADDERIGPLLMLLSYFPDDGVRTFVRSASEKNPHRFCQAVGCFALARSLAQETESVAVNEEIIRALERVEHDFADVKYAGESLQKAGEDLLYHRKFLGIGSEAPEIEALDVDGNSFKLGDYRGKVVLLDFWGDWCPYCVKSYPAIRLLVEQKQGQPFVVLGVNTDERERLRHVLDAKKVTWRTWADGPLPGPIAEMYKIDGVPSAFLLDAKGIIRFKFNGFQEGLEMTQAIEALLAEAAPATPDAPPTSEPADEPAPTP